MKRLIVSGDDFGLHPAINRGIIDAHQHGILTSASIVPCGQAFDNAIVLAKENPKLGIGIHLTFVEEFPISTPSEIASLVNANGRFPKSWKIMLTRLVIGQIRTNHLRKEAEAQIQKVFDAGIIPTHLDSHQHLHLFPTMWRALLPICKKYKIPSVRLLKHEIIPGYRGWKSMGLEFLSRRLSSRIEPVGLWSPDYVAGSSLGGQLTENIVKHLLDHLPNGTTELVCHPGKNDQELSRQYRWNYLWEQELAMLTSQSIKTKIANLGTQLCKFEPPKE